MTQPILIVGAGPTGLMMACQLALYQIPFRIIDKTSDHTTQSRALAIQARSLEIFDQMGIAQKAVSEGQQCVGGNILLKGKPSLHIPLTHLDPTLTKFPFILMLEQFKTEILLEDFIKTYGHKVEREVELTDFTLEADHVAAVLKDAHDQLETAAFSYIIGADGARSTVRNKLEIPFEGKTYQTSLFLIDCDVEAAFAPNQVYVDFSDKTAFAAFFPISNNQYRVVGSISEKSASKKDLTFDDLTTNFAENLHWNVTLKNPKWYAVYHSHHRFAAQFRVQRAFLVGDAAHIHSPVGGQGMNTGLQDAYNLAWKLAFVIRGQAQENLLDTYSEERMQVAKTLVHSTDKLFYLAIKTNWAAKIVKFWILPIVFKIIQPWVTKSLTVRQKLFEKLAELNINYQNSALSQHASYGHFANSAPKPGDRAPLLIQNKLKNPSMHLLIFLKNKEANTTRIEELLAHYPFITIQIIHFSESTKPIFKEMGVVDDQAVYLIRPDMYVAYRANHLNITPLKNYLRRQLEVNLR